jgi:CrcB protein
MRFLVTTAVVNRFGPGFPLATFLINVLGSFAVGIVSELALTRAFGISPEIRLFLAVGVLGGFTTFSSFALEAVTLMREGSTPLALGYGFGSLLVGIVAAYCGTIIARLSTSMS